MHGSETKIFDPNDPATGSNGAEVLDASVVWRAGEWQMVLAGQAHQVGAPQLFTAALAPGVPLSATGWQLARDASGELIPLVPPAASGAWDGDGGRHCPSYVRGFDRNAGREVERIYYAGASDHAWGPYSIGYLEWDGASWQAQPEPVFRATEEWERGSVFEPNVLYHDGKWLMWYVAGSHQENYLVHGCAESRDGREWETRTLFAPAEMRIFDFCVRRRGDGFEAVFSRIAEAAQPEQAGLWWCHATQPGSRLADWSDPVQIMNCEDKGWHSGPFKPSLAFEEQTRRRAFIFFDGTYDTGTGGPFPYAFTLGCLEIDLPE